MAEAATAAKPDLEASVESDGWTQALNLSCELTVDMPLPGFKVGDMLRLKRDSIVNSHWRLGTDVPLQVNGQTIAHGEFEVVSNHLALRLTGVL